MKCQAKVRQAMATPDGKALVVAYEDGDVQMFLIVDQLDQESITHLQLWRQQQLQTDVEDFVPQEIVEKELIEE